MPLYVPILKGKEGEFAALEALYPDAKSGMKPLIEVPAIPFNFVLGQQAKSLDEHISGLPGRIRRSWGLGEFYLETPFFRKNEHLADTRCAFEFLLSGCRELSLQPIPVISPRSSEACCQTLRDRWAVGQVLCVRLSLDDFAEEIDTDALVSGLLENVGRSTARGLDLLVDFGELKTEPATSLLLARYVLSSLPQVEEWRSIIFAATSFPEDLSSVNASSVVSLPRHEWTLWTALHRKRSRIPQNLIFGDYAISHPKPSELDPRIMRMSANIRYTAPGEWLIVKGRNVNQYGFEQFYDLCKTLIEKPEYLGQDFSWGDRFIHDCAKGMAGPGNATTWRKVGVNHHIAFIVSQLASPHEL